MIIRIMGEGQYRVPEALCDELNRIDNRIVTLVAEGKTREFRTEFMKLISNIKLGAALSIIKVSNVYKISELIVKVQPANITLAAGRALSAEERDIYRADCAAKLLDEIVDKNSLK